MYWLSYYPQLNLLFSHHSPQDSFSDRSVAVLDKFRYQPCKITSLSYYGFRSSKELHFHLIDLYRIISITQENVFSKIFLG